MADAVTGAIVGKLVEYLVDGLKDQVSYLCCYSCNVPRLADEVEELSIRYESVQGSVDAARNNLEIITPVVKYWLKGVEKVKEESDRIQKAAKEVGRSCLCKRFPVLHYSLSRDAVKTTESAIELLKEILPVRICNPRIPAEMDPVPSTSEYEFKSRDDIEEQIMKALKDQSVYLIGIHGMGGMGKTTMARKIGARAKKEMSIFDLVVMATFSHLPDLPKIQNDIAEQLGLKLCEEALHYRARKLHERLMAEEKGVLIILDDVWEKLNLEDLGIPHPRNDARCKLILTSRDMHTLELPGNPVSRIFRLEVLNDKESWILFRDNAGDAVDSPDLIEIAKDIARECKGLPLALKIVGCALKGKNKSYWENALKELQKSMPTNIEDVEQRVYGPLMYNIEQLVSPDARSLFLLCCLFPEDYNISLEELVRCGMGLRIFEEEELMEARKKVESVLHNLISRALLIKSTGYRDTLYIRMHDVIRDMGIWMATKRKIEFEVYSTTKGIASKGTQVFMVSHGNEKWPMREEESYGYTCISLSFSKEDVDIPEFMNCPRLELLHIHLKGSYPKIPENFFSGMGSLRVLEASYFGSLPSSVGLLKNLRTLYLYRCIMIGMTYVIGELTNLEILCLKDCKVDVLPEKMGGLKKLKQLDISNCEGLRVASGVISGLVKLEDLVILNSFDNWEAQANETTNASLAELDCLNYLTTLRIRSIQNPSVIPTERPHWVQKVKRYTLTVQNVKTSFSHSPISIFERRFHKAVTLKYKDSPLPEWLYDMASDAEYLDLAGPSCSMVVKRLGHYSSNPICLKCLSLSEFTDIQYLVGSQQNGAIFPMLKFLYIRDSPSLLEISNVPPSAGSFAALEEINLRSLSGLTNLWEFPTEKLYLSNLIQVVLDDCENLAYLFSLSIARSLTRLEVLKVSNCPMMEEIFKKEDGEMEINKIEFPKLDSLFLQSMESLYHLCKKVDRVEIPKVRWLELVNLPSIIALDIDQSCIFKQQFAGNFNELQRLRVERIDNLKYVFTSSILSGFSNLQELTVKECLRLEEVIRMDENVGETILFPNLQNLELFDLPNICTFCYAGVEMPSLQKLDITNCPQFSTFTTETGHYKLSPNR